MGTVFTMSVFMKKSVLRGDVFWWICLQGCFLELDVYFRVFRLYKASLVCILCFTSFCSS